MILYKYMSFDATKKAIETPSVGFSCLEDLNDPFECTAFGFKDDENTIVNARIATNACKNRFSRKYGVLSLTRQPLNALMWSHYGDSHQGIVIGIDVDMAGLSDMASCIIPSQYGEVIYTATKPHKDMPIISSEELMDIGDSIKFDPNTYNLVKRAFLYKSLEWGYEEEVRIVKNISALPFSYHFSEGRHDNWRKINISGRPLYLLDIPVEAIKEVYLGKNIYKNISRRNLFSHDEYCYLLQSWKDKGIALMRCEPDINSWNLITHMIEI
ncbi:MAG: DUF2971 domain-containing protein [Gammaproteobacteria bacterium]|nr:DUF2971 domain-containing protein [Gammaproteobacteria bacterium]MBU1724820.1 DUF2971 domain-containing protein [Gammaproteobacteria bacterium]MBU2006517.1 DUF2971 domain-containing protein [Gammaproteobacteria bacterium]